MILILEENIRNVATKNPYYYSSHKFAFYLINPMCGREGDAIMFDYTFYPDVTNMTMKGDLDLPHPKWLR